MRQRPDRKKAFAGTSTGMMDEIQGAKFILVVVLTKSSLKISQQVLGELDVLSSMLHAG
jgi:hypothetical protein